MILCYSEASIYRAAFVIFFTCKLDSSLVLRGWRQTSPSSFPPPHPLQTYCSLQVFSGFLLANAQAASLTVHSAVQICETYKTYKYTISSDNYFYAKVKVIVLMSVVTTILQLSLTDNNRGPYATTTTTAVKTSLKNEFASCQTLSRLFGTAQFVKCRRLFPGLNS